MSTLYHPLQRLLDHHLTTSSSFLNSPRVQLVLPMAQEYRDIHWSRASYQGSNPWRKLTPSLFSPQLQTASHLRVRHQKPFLYPCRKVDWLDLMRGTMLLGVHECKGPALSRRHRFAAVHLVSVLQSLFPFICDVPWTLGGGVWHRWSLICAIVTQMTLEWPHLSNWIKARSVEEN